MAGSGRSINFSEGVSNDRPSCSPVAGIMGRKHDQRAEQADRDHQGHAVHQGEGSLHVSGGTRAPKSLLLSNIQGLMGSGGKSKMEFLRDQATLHNSLAVAVTETWLKPDINSC